MESPLITYTLTACHAFLFRTVKDLSRASSSYDDGIEIIRNGMMRTFGVDWHDEGMAVVYTIIDNEAWDWGREEMNTLWRSWREHRQVSRCYLNASLSVVLTGHRTFGVVSLLAVRARLVILRMVQSLLGID